MAQDLDGHMLRNTRFTVDFESRRRERPRQVGIDEPWRPLGGAKPPAGCEAGDRAIPWNRADGLERTPQFQSPFALAILAAALLLIGLVRGPGVRRARRAGVALTLLVAVLWFV